MELKVYAERLSQPSRAILIFCKANKLDFEEVKIEILKGQHLTPEFKEINPMGQVPAIVIDGKFKLVERLSKHTLSVACPCDPFFTFWCLYYQLFCSFIYPNCYDHAILTFLASAFPGVSDHWYPSDIYKRAEVHSILDWHHSNLRRGSVKFLLNTILAPIFGRPLNPQAAAEGEKVLSSSLSHIETVWLKDSGQFLLGLNELSIADLSLVCEIMQLELADEADRNRILGPYKKVQQWIEATKNATNPHFDEVHEALFGAKSQRQMQQSAADSS